MRSRPHPEASLELEGAAIRYEREEPGLGDAFLAEVSRGIAAIEESTATWPFVRKGLRIQRFVLVRFPFSILYQVKTDYVLIVAFAHGKRRPSCRHRRGRVPSSTIPPVTTDPPGGRGDGSVPYAAAHGVERT